MHRLLELEFVYETLKKGGPWAALAGIALLAVGLLLGKIVMVLAGGFVALLCSADYVFTRLFRKS
ncbi:MAG: hypothetical protein ABL984_12840 [Pyrinomonadaceae bacterium]